MLDMIGVVFERLQEMLKRFSGDLGWRIDKVEVAQPDVKVVVSLEPIGYLVIPDIQLPDLALDLRPELSQCLVAAGSSFSWLHGSGCFVVKQVIGSLAIRCR